MIVIGAEYDTIRERLNNPFAAFEMQSHAEESFDLPSVRSQARKFGVFKPLFQSNGFCVIYFTNGFCVYFANGFCVFIILQGAILSEQRQSNRFTPRMIRLLMYVYTHM